MTDEPMTPEEIAAARKWIGLGDEVTDAKVVEMTQGTVWLHKRRYNAAAEALKIALSSAIKQELVALRMKMVTPKD